MTTDDYAQAIAAEIHLLYAYLHKAHYKIPVLTMIDKIKHTDELKKECITILEKSVR